MMAIRLQMTSAAATTRVMRRFSCATAVSRSGRFGKTGGGSGGGVISGSSGASSSSSGRRHLVSGRIRYATIGGGSGCASSFPPFLSSASFLSTEAASSKKVDEDEEQRLALKMKERWGSYLSSGRGSEDLFESIATNSGGGTTISPQDVRAFLQTIDRKAVSASAFAKLQAMADDYPMSLRDFQNWLISATRKFANGEPDAQYQLYYKTHPNTGRSSREDDDDEEDKHEKVIVEPKWNASTMNQAVRRMQYAVRGSVVMLAEKLQSEGRDILYTNSE